MKKIYLILSVLCASLFAISCSNEETENTQEEGYLKLRMTTLVSTNTRTAVPQDYNARDLHVELLDANNNVLMQTDDFANDQTFQGTIRLEPGTYTISAHSANWDGSDSGFDAPFYAGSAQVTIKPKTLTTVPVTLTQANVKVTVNYDQTFLDYFTSAQATVTSDLTGVAARTFIMGQASTPAYFPVAPLTFNIAVVNQSGDSFSQDNRIEDVNARDHFIVTYKVADAGKQGAVTVSVDDATQTYSFTVEVPRKSSTALQVYNVNAWAHFANLSGAVTSKTADFDAADLTLQWKKATDADWTSVASNLLTANGDNYSYKLTGLEPETSYIYRLSYTSGDVNVNSNEVSFTTESATAIYNGGFEFWTNVGSYYSPNEDGVTYWDSSNGGSASFNYIVTEPSYTFVHSGNGAVKLTTKYAVIKLAAGSVYTGKFGKVTGTNANLFWGTPFTGRPTALKAYISYAPGAINKGTKPTVDGHGNTLVGVPESGENDYCNLRIALLTEQLEVTTKDMASFPVWENDDRILAHGYYTQNTSDNGQWREVIIPLTYYNTTTKPAYLLVASASSAYGDYFYGSDASVLYVDDIELIYGDDPVIAE